MYLWYPKDLYVPYYMYFTESTDLLTKSATFDFAETEDRVSEETLQCLRKKLLHSV